MEEEAKVPTISLRPFQLSDVDQVMEWMSDPLVVRYTSWKILGSRDEALEFMKASVLPHPWYRAVCLDGKAVGFISVTPESGAGRCRAEVMTGLARKYWRQRIALTAFRMATAAVLSEWPQLERLDALVAVENEAAMRGLEKVGYIREAVHRKYRVMGGRVRDVARYSLLRTESKL